MGTYITIEYFHLEVTDRTLKRFGDYWFQEIESILEDYKVKKDYDIGVLNKEDTNLASISMEDYYAKVTDDLYGLLSLLSEYFKGHMEFTSEDDRSTVRFVLDGQGEWDEVIADTVFDTPFQYFMKNEGKDLPEHLVKQLTDWDLARKI